MNKNSKGTFKHFYSDSVVKKKLPSSQTHVYIYS